MKKIKILLIIFILFFVSSCGKDEHVHTFSDWIIDSNPTCVTTGLKHKECTACQSMLETEIIDKMGHDLVHHEKLNPTCNAIGHNEYDTCTRCDYSTYIALPKMEHQSSSWMIDSNPTCAETGVKHQECTICHEVLETIDIDKLDHDLVHYDGLVPTCIEAGYREYDICTKCDYSTYEILEAFGHTASEWIVDSTPTCIETGSKYKRCTVCYNLLEFEIFEELGHNLIHYEKLEPTCTAKGHSEYDTCTRCDYSTYAALSKIEHKYENYV